jgi:hypothetical protein
LLQVRLSVKILADDDALAVNLAGCPAKTNGIVVTEL